MVAFHTPCPVPGDGVPALWPPAVAMISGKGGVGRSSLVLNLALSLGRTGNRVLVVDADPRPGHVALLGGIEPPRPLFGTDRVEVAALVAGVDLAQLFPAAGAAPPGGGRVDGEALATLEMQYRWLLVDTGPGIDATALAAARAADAALVVLTPELTAVADGYAMVKALTAHAGPHRLGTIVNMAEDLREAQDLHAGFADLADRFLGAQIDNRGYIPLDPEVREAAKCQSPFGLVHPSTPAAAAVANLASEFIERHPSVTRHHRRAYLEGVAVLVSAAAAAPPAMSPVQEPSLIA